MKLLIVNGPNINLLGIREPEIYGTQTYRELVAFISDVCAENGTKAEIFQSNIEGELVDEIQHARTTCDGIVINAAAYSHTSIAILDALKAVGLPAAAVHLTDVSRREEFRHVSFTSLGCLKTFAGQGFESYRAAIEFIIGVINGQKA